MANKVSPNTETTYSPTGGEPTPSDAAVEWQVGFGLLGRLQSLTGRKSYPNFLLGMKVSGVTVGDANNSATELRPLQQSSSQQLSEQVTEVLAHQLQISLLFFTGTQIHCTSFFHR